MIDRRTIFSTLIVAALFALPVVVRAFTINDIQQASEDIQCAAQNIGNIVDRFNSNYLRQSIARTRQAYLESFSNFPEQWLMCILGSIHTSPGVGNSARACATDIASANLREAQFQVVTNFENDLITDCAAQSDIRAIINAAREILLQNGRDGGAVYVQDWRAFQADNRYRGLQIARNEMANTKHCSWVSGQLQGLFSYDPTNAAPPLSGNEDGQNSYIRDAGCSLPDDFNPAAPQYQTTEAFAAMMLPQNNIWGSYLLAQEEVRRQVADEEQAAQNEFANTGGVGALRAINPATGNSCAVMAADGSTCLQYSNIEQPAAGVVAEVNAQRQALYDLITNPRTTSEVVNDVRANLVSSFMSLTQPLAQLQYRRDPADQSTPSPLPVPGSGDRDDPICTGGIPGCSCAINDQAAQALARGAVLTATRAAISQNPQMLTPDGGSVLQGMNIPFLQAVCQAGNLSAIGSCRPNNSGFGLVITFELEVNVDVLLPNNVIRQPGVTTLICTEPGNM